MEGCSEDRRWDRLGDISEKGAGCRAKTDELPARDGDVPAEGAQHEHRAGVAERAADRTRRGGATSPAFAAAAAVDGEVGPDGAAEAVGLHLEARVAGQDQPDVAGVRDELVTAAPREIARVIDVATDRPRHEAIGLHVVHA